MKYKSQLKAIRAKCMDCCDQQIAEVRYCHLSDCPLWYFRFGCGPNAKRVDPELMDPEKVLEIHRDREERGV